MEDSFMAHHRDRKQERTIQALHQGCFGRGRTINRPARVRPGGRATSAAS